MEATKQQDGNILVSTLLILLVMNLLGVGLVQTAAKESRIATFKTVDSEVFHITESCARDTITWFKTQTSPPAALPYVITANDISHMYTGNEGSDELNKLNGYSYNCTTDSITVKTVSGDFEGIGEEIGDSSGYGIAGDLTPRYYYDITSNGSGPQNSTKTIYSIVSVEF